MQMVKMNFIFNSLISNIRQITAIQKTYQLQWNCFQLQLQNRASVNKPQVMTIQVIERRLKYNLNFTLHESVYQCQWQGYKPSTSPPSPTLTFHTRRSIPLTFNSESDLASSLLYFHRNFSYIISQLVNKLFAGLLHSVWVKSFNVAPESS